MSDKILLSDLILKWRRQYPELSESDFRRVILKMLYEEMDDLPPDVRIIKQNGEYLLSFPVTRKKRKRCKRSGRSPQ